MCSVNEMIQKADAAELILTIFCGLHLYYRTRCVRFRRT